MAKIPETSHTASAAGGIPRFALAICAWLLLTVTLALVTPTRPGFAQSSVGEMIAEYQRLQRELKSASEIAENQKDYSKSEVEKAIDDRINIVRRLPALKNQILARGGKIPGKKKPPEEEKPDPGEAAKPDAEQKPVAEAELKLTVQQKSYIGKEERRIRLAKDKLLNRINPNDKKAVERQKNIIKRSEDRIRKKRAEAQRTLRVPPGGEIRAKQGEESLKKKAPEAKRPWKLGHWPWKFDKPPEIPGISFYERRFTEHDLLELKQKYYDLQAEMGATLLIRRKGWTGEQAINYNGKLSVLCALIIDTEERIAFGLGDPVKFGRAIRTKKQKWRLYLAKQKDTDAAEAVMNATAAEYFALLKKSGLKPGDTVSSDDPNARKLNQLAARFVMEQEHFLEVRKVSERAKFASGVISDAIKQRIKGGIAFTVKNPPKLEIHRLCGSGDSSLVYEMFLDDDEWNTFGIQNRDRYRATNR